MNVLKKFSVQKVLFVLLALLAVVLLGSTAEKPRRSDLNVSAEKLAAESARDISSVAEKNPGVILRANAIEK